jgi:hypothetical protein
MDNRKQRMPERANGKSSNFGLLFIFAHKLLGRRVY